MTVAPLAVHWFWIFWTGVILLVLAAVAIAVLRGGLSGLTHPPAPPAETPLDILARRFASGEITADEFQKGRDLLQGGGKS
jgi:uncharacterized membrane protein